MDKVDVVIYTLICAFFAFGFAVNYHDLLNNNDEAASLEPNPNGSESGDSTFFLSQSRQEYNIGPSSADFPRFEDRDQEYNIGPSSEVVPGYEEEDQEHNIGLLSEVVVPRFKEEDQEYEEFEEEPENKNNSEVEASQFDTAEVAEEEATAPQPEPEISEEIRSSFDLPEEPNYVYRQVEFIPVVIGFLPVNRHFSRLQRCRHRRQVINRPFGLKPYADDAVVMSGGNTGFDPVFRGGVWRVTDRWTGSDRVDRFGGPRNSYDLQVGEKVVEHSEIKKEDEQGGEYDQQEQEEQVFENTDKSPGSLKGFRKFLNRPSQVLNI